MSEAENYPVTTLVQDDDPYVEFLTLDVTDVERKIMLCALEYYINKEGQKVKDPDECRQWIALYDYLNSDTVIAQGRPLEPVDRLADKVSDTFRVSDEAIMKMREEGMCPF